MIPELDLRQLIRTQHILFRFLIFIYIVLQSMDLKEFVWLTLYTKKREKFVSQKDFSPQYVKCKKFVQG